LADVARHEKGILYLRNTILSTAGPHEIVTEKTLAADPKKYAVCLDGKNACPPEDCRGIWGYYDLLKAVILDLGRVEEVYATVASSPSPEPLRSRSCLP
jgi:hypothetical protein